MHLTVCVAYTWRPIPDLNEPFGSPVLSIRPKFTPFRREVFCTKLYTPWDAQTPILGKVHPNDFFDWANTHDYILLSAEFNSLRATLLLLTLSNAENLLTTIESLGKGALQNHDFLFEIKARILMREITALRKESDVTHVISVSDVTKLMDKIRILSEITDCAYNEARLLGFPKPCKW